jgi:hypothetical protein
MVAPIMHDITDACLVSYSSPDVMNKVNHSMLVYVINLSLPGTETNMPLPGKNCRTEPASTVSEPELLKNKEISFFATTSFETFLR